MKISHHLFACLFAMLAALPSFSNTSVAADAPTDCAHQPTPATAKGKRVAIIVGNDAYSGGIPALANPSHDAEATSKALAALGFEIFLSTNATSARLQQCLDQAYSNLAATDVVVLYYSGHGIQIKDENYLVATDAALGDFKHGFVPVQPIVDALQKQAKAVLVFLDACRKNPMAEDGHVGLSVSTGRGLKPVTDAPPADNPGVVQAQGLMVAYATSPNAVALDGNGHNSPFTSAFVKLVGTSGYSIQHVLSDVTKSVGEETGWEQTPWMKSSLTSELKLGGGETLAEAQSISDNHAARAQTLLDVDGKRVAAIVEALKGLPALPDEAALKLFPKAYLALYAAVQNRDTVLPLPPGMTRVAVSTQNRAAIYKLSPDYRSGELDLWSTTEKAIVAKPSVGGNVSEFFFSPHGKLLAVVTEDVTTVLNGLDGSKLFDVHNAGHVMNAEFSPDETRLLLTGDGDSALTIIDVGTGKPSIVVGAEKLLPNRGSGRMVQANFSGNDAVCFALELGDFQRRALGVFDLKDKRTSRLRETNGSVTVTMCDPAGKYMVRTFAVGAADSGMEIWDLVHDKVTQIKAPIVNILGIDPKGDYVSVIAMAAEAQGFYDLATGKKGYPNRVPEGFVIYGSRVRNESGGLVSQDLSPNAWRDWPDEALFGTALAQKALAGLSAAQRQDVERERITYAEVVAGP